LHCDGGLIIVSEHVHTALEDLFRVESDCSFAIWIDALCIDQDDEIEKSKQVPHMGAIYSLAGKVIVWVGRDQLVDQHYEQLERLVDSVKSLPVANTWDERDERLTEAPPPVADKDELWIAVGNILSSRWFRRLWTVQELCLARSVDVLCGHYLISWDILEGLSKWAVKSPEYRSEFEFLDLCRRYFKGYEIYTAIILPDSLRERLVSKPIDRIYGLLFLLPDILRHQIKVDYSQEREYWIVYIKLAHLLLLQPGGLIILRFAPGKRPVQLPSWCPNWNARQSILPFLSPSDLETGSGGLVWPSEASGVRLQDNLRNIEVLGFRIDRIVDTCSFPTKITVHGWEAELARQWVPWQQECLERLKAMKPNIPYNSVLSTHMRTLRMNMWGLSAGQKFSSKAIREKDWPEIESCYEEALSCADHAHPPEAIESGDMDIPEFIKSNPTLMRDTTYFFTEQGRVGRGLRGEQAGDILVVLYVELREAIHRMIRLTIEGERSSG
jgi:hypothetical protein